MKVTAAIALSTLLVFTCNEVKETKDFKVFQSDLPVLDPSLDCGASTRYKNSLHEGNYLLEFNVMLVYHESPFDLNPVDYKSIVETQLNEDFSSEGVIFSVKEEKTTYTELSIEDHEKLFKEYYEPNHIIIILCDDEFFRFSGIVDNIPGSSLAVQKSVLPDRKTLPHEMGHVFGLKHIFEPDNLNANTLNSGDNICDTPPYNIMDHRTSGCSYHGKPKYTEEDLKVIIPNYMNYSFEEDDCRKRFTPQQSLAMRWYIENFPQLYNTLN
jgi:Pregnancy-associated plasma protein-A